MFQFVKSAKWKVGEETALRALGRLHEQTGEGGPVDWHKMGEGWSWSRQARRRDATTPPRPPRAGRRSSATWPPRRTGFYVLDEFTYPMKWGWVDVDEVVATLRDRPGHQHVVITGRDAHPELVEAADLVTEMTKVKHPMDAGQKGQRGIEW